MEANRDNTVKYIFPFASSKKEKHFGKFTYSTSAGELDEKVNTTLIFVR